MVWGWGSMRAVATPLLCRIYYNVSEKPVVMDRVFKDWKPGGVISCKTCGEVSAGAMTLSSALEVLILRQESQPSGCLHWDRETALAQEPQSEGVV